MRIVERHDQNTMVRPGKSMKWQPIITSLIFCILMNVCCYRQYLLKQPASPERLIESARTHYTARPSFKGQGAISIRQPDGTKTRAEFSSVVIGDSLLRIQIFHPIGGTIADFRMAHNRYRLDLPRQDRERTGIYTDSLARSWFYTDIPHDLLFCLAGARPFIPHTPFAAVAADGNKRYRYIFAQKVPQEVVLEAHDVSSVLLTWGTISVFWSKPYSFWMKSATIKDINGTEITFRFTELSQDVKFPISLFTIED